MVGEPRMREKMSEFLGNQREEEGIKKIVNKENPEQNSWHGRLFGGCEILGEKIGRES